MLSRTHSFLQSLTVSKVASPDSVRKRVRWTVSSAELCVFLTKCRVEWWCLFRARRLLVGGYNSIFETSRREFHCLYIWSNCCVAYFSFGNKFFNSFRDSGLPNVTERRKENLFLPIYSMMSKNSKSVYKYISVIQCILTYCNIISIEIPKIMSPINFHHCRRF